TQSTKTRSARSKNAGVIAKASNVVRGAAKKLAKATSAASSNRKATTAKRRKSPARGRAAAATVSVRASRTTGSRRATMH
ncbi:MAG: hypothetical protein AAB250_00665, partial [Bdellovibrionota bacterium]